MKIYFSQKNGNTELAEEDFSPISLHDSIEKTRRALDIAYAGFDYALDNDLIDSYIYEINSLQKRYAHLSELASSEVCLERKSRIHPSIKALVSHVFG